MSPNKKVKLDTDKQKTLAAFKFTKVVVHRDEKTEVAIPEVISSRETYLQCNVCQDFFKNQQALSVHRLCKHSKEEVNNNTESLENICKFVSSETVANFVLESMLSVVFKEAEKSVSEAGEEVNEESREESNVKTSKRRGSEKRRQYSASYKLDVIREIENEEATEYSLEEKYKINRSLINKWKNNKKKISDAAVREHKNILKIRPSVKYTLLFTKLVVKLREARRKLHRVNFNWLLTQARILYKEEIGDSTVILGRHVIVNFLKKHNIKMRARQRNRKLPKESFRMDLQKWHVTTRERLVRMGGEEADYDSKWGYFSPKQRFNVDQSPLPFAVNMSRTYHMFDEGADKHKEKVWISQPGSGLDKRQCTLQICFSPVGPQPKLGIIFRGKGRKISEEEKASWHPDVDIYFQENAWADTKFSVEWAERTLKPCVENLKRFVLFCDNLTSQTHEDFKTKISSLGGVVWYGLPNATDLWQPVDAGFGELLKTLINHKLTSWLEGEENADRWYGNSTGFTAKERRILISNWAGEAYNVLVGQKYEKFCYHQFEKTGCLITADGSEDTKITPEGLKDYNVPPPSLLDPSPHTPQGNVIVERDDLFEELEGMEPPDNQFNDNVLNENDYLEDNIEDRIDDHDLKGKEVDV